jgi:hypothetical protein
VTGFYWYDLYGGPSPVYSGDNYNHRFGAQNGMALLAKDALVTNAGKYFILSRKETRPLEELPQYGVPGADLSGKPSIYGSTLYVSNRVLGKVSIVDISKIEKPRLLKSFDLEGNPGIVAEHNGVAVIPAGYQGLLSTWLSTWLPR